MATSLVIGQVIGYMAWAKEFLLAEGEDVIGVIVASKVHPLLLMAADQLNGALPIFLIDEYGKVERIA